MPIAEIKPEQLDPKAFIEMKVKEIRAEVGAGSAINALSGGVDSSVVTLLGHRALGDRFRTVLVENGLMRAGEPEYVVAVFRELGVNVEVVDARDVFFSELKGLTDPEEKRNAITRAFYKKVFGDLVRKSQARFLFHGTNLTDVEETVAGVKRQHNILAQLGIDPEKEYGYKVIEPLLPLRKTAVRMVGKALGLPEEIYARPPFPGPALATRVIGEVTPERVETVRKATALVEEAFKGTGAFQYLAVLHQDMATGVRAGKRDFGMQVEVRCWDSKDAVIATPTRVSVEMLEALARRITTEVPGVVSVTYNVTPKPPSTIEVI